MADDEKLRVGTGRDPMLDLTDDDVGDLVSGQNPASSDFAAKAPIGRLAGRVGER